jgi:hypothetical protein
MFSGNDINRFSVRIRTWKHPLEINFLFTVRTRLLLPDYTPASYTELVESGAVKENTTCNKTTTGTLYGSWLLKILL